MTSPSSTPLTMPLRHGAVCVVEGYGVGVHVKRRHLVVKDGFGAKHRERVFSRATHGLARLVHNTPANRPALLHEEHELRRPSGLAGRAGCVRLRLVPVNIKRLFGFQEAVDLTLSAPKSLKGLKPAKASIAKGEHEHGLQLTIPKDASPGSYDFSLEADLKFNSKTLKIDQKVPVQIVAAEPANNP